MQTSQAFAFSSSHDKQSALTHSPDDFFLGHKHRIGLAASSRHSFVICISRA
jgi:hypothetical protein